MCTTPLIFDMDERRLLLLALGHLAGDRPAFVGVLRRLAARLGDMQAFERARVERAAENHMRPWTVPVAHIHLVRPADDCAHPVDVGYHWDCPRCGWHCYHRVVSALPATHTSREALAADPLCGAC